MARQSVDRVALARRIGRAEAVAQERERLRPLLEQLERDVTILSRAFHFTEPASLTALRAELGKE